MIRKFILYTIFLFSIFLNAQNNWDAQIDQNFRQVLEKHKALVSIPNLPENIDNMMKNVEWVSYEFKALDYKVSVLEATALPVLFAEKIYDKNFKTVLFYIHLDGQPVNPKMWDQEDPFIPVLKKQTQNGDWEAINWNNLDKKIVIAQAYISLNQFDNAIEYLRKIKYEADSEREPEIQYYIGEAYLKAGQYENAIAEFVKIPLLSKKTKLQWEASALYYSGQSYEKLGRIDDAVRMYQEIVSRPGIDLVLKREAEKRIQQIQ